MTDPTRVRALSEPDKPCALCGHPMGQHSWSFGCIARDDDGDCLCEERQ